MSTIKITAPEYCPFCGSPVVKQLKDGAHLYCSNKDCKERLLQQLNYFVTKQCMNIDGLSEKTLRKLQSAGLVNYWYDLYSLTFDQCVNAGLGDKTSLKLIDELAKSRTQVPAENVLMALGIPMIGKVAAQELLAEFGSIKEIENAADLRKGQIGDIKVLQVSRARSTLKNADGIINEIRILLNLN